jgi:predicted acyl esterase
VSSRRPTTSRWSPWRALVLCLSFAVALYVFAGLPVHAAVAAAHTNSSTCTRNPGGLNYDDFPGEVERSYYCYYTYAKMPDGTQIALAVSYPAGYDASHRPRRLPTLLEIDGYDGGGGALDPNSYGNEYVMVHASVRGTGCSSGQLDLFSWQDAEDGAQIVNDWIPKQKWSNGHVGIIGHSYPGLTGFMTAERIGYDKKGSPLHLGVNPERV